MIRNENQLKPKFVGAGFARPQQILVLIAQVN